MGQVLPASSDPILSAGEYGLYLPLLFSQLSEPSPFLDLQDREAVAQYFMTEYLQSPLPSMSWTGSLTNCNAGTLSADYQAAVLQRINFFRRMAGLAGQVTFTAAYNEKAQAAALMMARNQDLNHAPPSNWLCYSALGYSGAGTSNLALGANGWQAINLYMQDPGAGNGAAGHRRWILYPQTRQMGNGDIPGQSGTYAANALLVINSSYNDPRPETREAYVAWPPPGYVPYQVVYPRWSFSYAGADFSSATISMTINGQVLPLQKEIIANGYGENSLVWIPNGLTSWSNWARPAADERYTVSIQKVLVPNPGKGNAYEWRNFSYDVIVFDPET
jgi:hypothetical protein